MTLVEVGTPRAVGGPERGVVSYFLKIEVNTQEVFQGSGIGKTEDKLTSADLLGRSWVDLVSLVSVS